MNKLSLAVLLAVSTLQPLSATAIGSLAPSVTITVDGQAVDTSGLSFGYDPASKSGFIRGAIETPGWELNLDVNTNPDPFVLYAVGVTNFTAGPLAFNFIFGTPVVLGPYNHVTSSFNGSVTDLRGDGSSLSGATQLALLDAVSVPSVALGPFVCADGPSAPLTNHACPVGPGFGPVSGFVPSANYVSLAADLSFTISANDASSLNGGVQLDAATQTPEPATVFLGFLSLALIPVARRFRR